MSSRPRKSSSRSADAGDEHRAGHREDEDGRELGHRQAARARGSPGAKTIVSATIEMNSRSRNVVSAVDARRRRRTRSRPAVAPPRPTATVIAAAIASPTRRRRAPRTAGRARRGRRRGSRSPRDRRDERRDRSQVGQGHDAASTGVARAGPSAGRPGREREQSIRATRSSTDDARIGRAIAISAVCGDRDRCPADAASSAASPSPG